MNDNNLTVSLSDPDFSIHVRKILIIGLGLMGGSIAEALSRKGCNVAVIDPNEASINTALENGWITEGKTSPDERFLSEFDLVIFAVYPHAMINWLKVYGKHLRKDTVITDVTGVKCPYVYEAQDILGDAPEFISAHPMAGRESQGIAFASGDIFKGANYIITPTLRNSDKAISVCNELGRLIGCKKISTVTPEYHDEMIGFLSQLTHCIAVALMTCRDTENMAAFSGDSFRELTRIAKINPDMWSELFIANKKALISEIEQFENQLTVIKNAVCDDDINTLKSIMSLSTKRRQSFDRESER